MFRYRGVRLTVAAGVLLCAASPLRAQDEGPTEASGSPTSHAGGPAVAAGRAMGGSIQLDGRLTEALWRTVMPATNFIQTEPNDGRPGTERTEVYFLYDAEALYVGARMYDSSGQVRSRLGRRDSFLADSDWLYVTLDTHHDHVSAYQFSVNPAGVKRDERTSGGRGDDSWDAVWDVATHVDDEGWSAELRIPFSQLRFSGAPDQTWGIQISRRLNRRQEVTVLAWTPKGEPGGVSRYAHLTGLRDIESTRPFEVQPYVMSRAEYVRAAPGDPYRDGSDYFAGAGLDVKYRVTSSLTIDATLNPDFGQVELDPAVVNLSAFETSLDERRPFFIEGRDVFAFGNNDQRGLFYSRRIGRAPQGSLPSGVAYADRPDAATILGAAKLTGRTARGLSVGLLAAATAEESAPWVLGDGTTGESVVEPRSTYVVGRLRQDMNAGDSNIGGIATFMHRDLGTESLHRMLRSRAFAGGVDFEHRFLARTWSVEGYATASHVLGSSESMLRTQLSSARYFARPDAGHLRLDSARTSLTGFAARVEVGKRSGLHWRGEASASTASPGYEINDAGFQTNVDRVSSGGNITYVENSPGRLFRNYRVTLGGNTEWNYGGDLLTARNSLNLNAQLRNYWGGSLNLTRSFDTWDDRLTRGGPVTRDIGGQNISGNISSDNRRRLSGRVNANYSWNRAGGWHRGTSLNLNLRPAENWTVSMGPRLDRSRSMAQFLTSVADAAMTETYGRRYLFAQLRQTTLSLETRLNVNFSPDVSLELFAQPFVSSGDYGTPAQLSAARTFEFDVFGRDVGTVAYDGDRRRYEIDPDGTGPASSFTVADRDFTNYSLRGNAVLRWEWQPGSTLFLVWQQRRAGRVDDGSFEFGRDSRAIFGERADNVLVMKVNYWLNL